MRRTAVVLMLLFLCVFCFHKSYAQSRSSRACQSQSADTVTVLRLEGSRKLLENLHNNIENNTGVGLVVDQLDTASLFGEQVNDYYFTICSNNIHDYNIYSFLKYNVQMFKKIKSPILPLIVITYIPQNERRPSESFIVPTVSSDDKPVTIHIASTSDAQAVDWSSILTSSQKGSMYYEKMMQNALYRLADIVKQCEGVQKDVLRVKRGDLFDYFYSNIINKIEANKRILAEKTCSRNAWYVLNSAQYLIKFDHLYVSPDESGGALRDAMLERNVSKMLLAWLPFVAPGHELKINNHNRQCYFQKSGGREIGIANQSTVIKECTVVMRDLGYAVSDAYDILTKYTNKIKWDANIGKKLVLANFLAEKLMKIIVARNLVSISSLHAYPVKTDIHYM